MNVNDTTKYVVLVCAGIACIVLGILGVTVPPILNLPLPPIVFFIVGFGALGVPLNTGLQASRASTATKAAGK
jgi:uncharacterized membrane-anchored protein